MWLALWTVLVALWISRGVYLYFSTCNEQPALKWSGQEESNCLIIKRHCEGWRRKESYKHYLVPKIHKDKAIDPNFHMSWNLFDTTTCNYIFLLCVLWKSCTKLMMKLSGTHHILRVLKVSRYLKNTKSSPWSLSLFTLSVISPAQNLSQPKHLSHHQHVCHHTISQSFQLSFHLTLDPLYHINILFFFYLLYTCMLSLWEVSGITPWCHNVLL